jgi:hypothetical protein
VCLGILASRRRPRDRNQPIQGSACAPKGPRRFKVGFEALLRKECIYSSHLFTWWKQAGADGAAGLTARTPGRKAELDNQDRQLLAVTKENEALKHKLRGQRPPRAPQKSALCWTSRSRKTKSQPRRLDDAKHQLILDTFHCPEFID